MHFYEEEHTRITQPEAMTQSVSVLLLVLLLLVLVASGLALGLDDGGGDTVEVTLAVLGDAATTVGGELEHADLLERLADLALDVGGGVGV
ncbi:hypothetical protein EXIGLDRAFT_776157, partial [Exidia glandulosa HHB12029]